MKRFHAQHRLLKISLVYFLTLALLNCTAEKIKETTDDTANITQYLRDHEEYSSFLNALEITNYASFLNTYGTYTLFLPTNAAMKQYLQDMGVASLEEVPLADLKDLVRLHVLAQEVPTTLFTDGKIATPSEFGQFLITGVTDNNGSTSITINKSANIIDPNVETGNGVIHVIDKVLLIADKTLAQTIEADPSLSIFTEALKETGWYEKLNQPLTVDENQVASFLTVLTQTDNEFRAAGLNSLADLKTKYSHLGNPQDLKDSLNLFVSYRILPKLQYLADLAITSVQETKAPEDIITVKLDKDVILLNEEIFNKVLEKGISINRTKSDVTASNGVLHYVNANFFIKKRSPAAVYFDVADQEKLMNLTSIFRKHLGQDYEFTKDQTKDITWEGNSPLVYKDDDGVTTKESNEAWHGDVLELFRLRVGYIQNLEFTTPPIIKGTYKVWVNYRRNSKQPIAKVYFNGVELPKFVNFQELPTANTDDAGENVLASQGYKHPVHPYSKSINSRLVGVINVLTTGRHKIKFEAIGGSPGAPTWLDVIEFRPIDMDQIWPKLQRGGHGFVRKDGTIYNN
jgi:uncharacterized surface protein with fasciclin (FAS1) repeats